MGCKHPVWLLHNSEKNKKSQDQRRILFSKHIRLYSFAGKLRNTLALPVNRPKLQIDSHVLLDFDVYFDGVRLVDHPDFSGYYLFPNLLSFYFRENVGPLFLLSSFTFRNDFFEIVQFRFNHDSGRSLQFFVVVSEDLFSNFSEGFSYSSDDSDQGFSFYLRDVHSNALLKGPLLSLTEIVILDLIVGCYQKEQPFFGDCGWGKKFFSCFSAISSHNRPVLFQNLSRHVFLNFFALSHKYFGDCFDELYMILLTFVALSDESLNDGVLYPTDKLNNGSVNIVLYFHSLFVASKDLYMTQDREVPTWENDEEKSHYFGDFILSLKDSKFVERIKEELSYGYINPRLITSIFSVTFIKVL